MKIANRPLFQHLETTTYSAPKKAQVTNRPAPKEVFSSSSASLSATPTLQDLKQAAAPAPLRPLEKILIGQDGPLPPGNIVVFGASSDLFTNRLGRDGLGSLAESKLNDKDHQIILTHRNPGYSGAEYMEKFRHGDADSNPMSQEAFDQVKHLSGLDQPGATLTWASFKGEGAEGSMKALKDKMGDRKSILYGALPPWVYPDFVEAVAKSDMLSNPDSRIILDKPFGSSAADAKKLEEVIQHYSQGENKKFNADQVLLVDHFLAYPGTRNLAGLRVRPEMKDIFSKEYVDNVNVVMEETIFSNEREMFRKTGVLEDLIQNHGMQLLSVASMDIGSADTDAAGFRQARLDLVNSIQVEPGSYKKGQFQGFNDPKQGAPAGSLEHPSYEETYASFNFKLNTPKWQGVPFKMTSAKGVDRTRFGVDYHLKKLPPALAEKYGLDPSTTATLRVDAVPKADMRLLDKDGNTLVQFEGDSRIDPKQYPYAALLDGAMRGKDGEGLFVDPRESLRSWDIIEQLKAQDAPLFLYPRGTELSQVESMAPKHTDIHGIIA